MNPLQAIKAALTFLTQLLHVLWSSIFRRVPTFTCSRVADPLLAFPIATTSRQVTEAIALVKPSLFERYCWARKDDGTRQPIFSFPCPSPSNFCLFIQSRRKSKAGGSTEESHTSMRDDLSGGPWLSRTSLGFGELQRVKSCDAVLEIIDTVIRSNSCEASDLDVNSAEMGLSPILLSPPLSTALCDNPDLSMVNILTPKSTPRQSARASIIVTFDPKLSQDHTPSASVSDIADPAANVSPAIGDLGRRRGFKGAPLRIRARSLSQRLTSSFLAPLSPMTSASKEILSFVSPSGSLSNDVEKPPPADYTNINPFATNSPDPYYVPVGLPADDNLYDFSAYSKHTQRSSSGQSQQSLQFSQTTRIYDIAINDWSITSEPLGTVRPQRESTMRSSLNRDHALNSLLRSSLRMDSTPKTQISLERFSVSLDRATSGSYDSTRLSKVEGAGYELSNVDDCQVSRLRPLVQPARANPSATSNQGVMAVSFSRPQALSEIINLLDFDHASSSMTKFHEKYGGESDKENSGVLESHCSEVYAI